MGTAEPQAVQDARSSGFARWRLVLGGVLLALGVGDLLYMNIVLLPRVFVVEAVATHRPVVGGSPGSESSALAGSTSQVLAIAPALPSTSSRVEDSAPPSRDTSAPAAPVTTVPASAPAPGLVVAMAPSTSPSARLPPTSKPSVPAGTPPSPIPSHERSAPSFPPLLFSINSAWLSPAAGQTLASLATLLKSDSTLRVTLEGHTDDSGPERFNQVLSMKRAERVRARLEDMGVDRARIDIKGHGSDQPVDTEHTAKARARNRRVEIFLN